ncbi:hypothetical protein QVD17_03531 [Tagetes erecta]|uniref:Transferase, Chloramphenicol acetyltransferase-like domain protein n=1 Tax=Tagetes erecta TaxID=13708 RepID=A0AAD8P9T1_TARER|nr:hypothetical protein QVD17_03531 [Tagetes erecta]
MLQDLLASEENVVLVDKFIPSKDARNQLLAVQATMFECGGVALGVNAEHRIVDASTLCTFLNKWAAAMNKQEENGIEFAAGQGFTFNSSSTLLPGRCFKPAPLQPISDDDMSSKYIRKMYTFSESAISNMKAKARRHDHWSKVQLVSATIWKARISVDWANNNPRDSILLQAVNLRGKTMSLIPKHSCGNFWGFCATKAGTIETTEELTDRLTYNIKKTVNNFSKVNHNTEEGQLMVLKSFSVPYIPESTNVITATSWCKFPFYEVDFGFGKPTWVAPGCVPVVNSSCLMDEAQGNGIVAHVLLEVKDVPYFEKALQDDGIIA